MEKILLQLFEKNTLNEVDVDAIAGMTQEHPYFAAGHYFLAKKLQPGNDFAYQKQFQKALLYFSNPLWLRHQLLSRPTTDKARSTPSTEEHPVSSLDSEQNLQASSPDMIEDVFLHQEKDAGAPTAGTIEAETNTSLEPGEESRSARNLTFQAYHTVDYFASQGIKLSQETLSGDKLSKQMKSFTEWLKTMRRLPEPVVEEVFEKAGDHEVANHAAHSLEEKEVITEAMAEVLIKQGKKEKAMEIYNKLSLLNPHKSAYFAGLTEELKRL